MSAEQIKKLYEKGMYRKILEKMESLENSGQLAVLSAVEQAECFFYKNLALAALGDHEQALQVIEKLKREINLPKQDFSVLSLIVAQLHILWHTARLDDALRVSKEIEPVVASLKATERKEELVIISFFFETMGNIHFHKGNHDQAFDCYQQSLLFRKRLGTPALIARSLNNIGVILLNKDEPDQALDYQKQSLLLSGQAGNERITALSLLQIGYIHYCKGELDKALEYCQQSSDRYRQVEDAPESAFLSATIGTIYHAMGEPDKALKYYQQSLKLFEKTGNDIEISYSLFHLILVSLDLPDVDLARSYLSRLEAVYERTPEKVTSQYARSGRAILLKESKRMKDKMQAQNLLSELAGEKIIHHELAALVLIYLCELLLFELKSIGDDKVFKEVKFLVDKLYHVAQDRHSFSLSVRVLLLQAKLSMTGGDFQAAQQYIDQAKVFSEEKNLGSLARLAHEEQELLVSEFNKWQEIIERNYSLHERIRLAKVKEYFDEARKLAKSLIK